MKDVNEVMSLFMEIMNQANAGQQTAKIVAKQMYEQAKKLREMSDQLCLLARKLDGGQIAADKKVVVLKTEKDEKEYKKTKKTKKKYNLSKEARERARERMRLVNQKRKEERELRNKLMTAVV